MRRPQLERSSPCRGEAMRFQEGDAPPRFTPPLTPHASRLTRIGRLCIKKGFKVSDSLLTILPGGQAFVCRVPAFSRGVDTVSATKSPLKKFIRNYETLLRTISRFSTLVWLVTSLMWRSKDMGYVLMKYPKLLGFKLEGIMSTSIAYLVRIGVSPRDIGPVVTQYPHLLRMRAGTMIKPLADYLISIRIDKMSTQHYFFSVKLKIDPEGFARDKMSTQHYFFSVKLKIDPEGFFFDKMSTQHYFFSVKLKIDPEGFALKHNVIVKPFRVSVRNLWNWFLNCSDKRFEERLECNFTDAFMPSK
ncbi:hypothetical protein HID58_086815 [Brassica napus]|uniref:Uncharacterized protein n=1 Tax=Brassica napus TaxID=3708 RepID=A0ABQ7XSX4_BRANA|nr:hypothetical protein HID58_086815 [Brassica napus]